MPSKNRLKVYVPESYYHIYNRGINGQNIFKDKDDYVVFLNLLKRYLSKKPTKDNKGREYDNFHNNLELLAFCILPNHFHLLLYQDDREAIKDFMGRISTSYATYYNKKYKRYGPLFQDRFKASHILKDEYLHHISRYLHLNPKDYKQWEYSSLPYYLGKKKAEWVRPQKILRLFEDTSYPTFLDDYRDHRKMLDEIKSELAHI